MTSPDPATPLEIPTTRVFARRVAPVLVLLAVLLAALGHRRAAAADQPYLWLGAIGMVGVAAYFGLLRTGLRVDGEARRVTAWWRWLVLGGARTIEAAGKPIGVERAIHRSKEQGSYEVFRVVLDGHVLHTFSEHQGGAEAAGQLARQIAEHVGSPLAKPRDCPKSVRREALRSKYALAPLAFVVVAMVVGAFLIVFNGP